MWPTEPLQTSYAYELLVPIFFSALFGLGNIFCFAGILYVSPALIEDLRASTC